MLSSLFATSLIGVPKSHAVRRHIADDYGALANLKMIMFIFLVCMVTHDEWHLHEQRAMKLEVGESDRYDDEEEKKGMRSTSNELRVAEKISSSSHLSQKTITEDSNTLNTRKILNFHCIQ